MAISNGSPASATREAAAKVQQVKILVALALPLLIAVVIAGCGDQAGSTAGQPAGAPPAAVVHVTATAASSKLVPDPQEVVETVAPGTTPQFILQLKGAEKDRATARYAFAAAHQAELAQIPCYCGCAIYQHMHTSLKSCYMKTVGADGSITFTDHSVSCDICTGEVDMMTSMIASTPLQSIRDQIGKKYNYTGVWTDTPPIQ